MDDGAAADAAPPAEGAAAAGASAPDHATAYIASTATLLPKEATAPHRAERTPRC